MEIIKAGAVHYYGFTQDSPQSVRAAVEFTEKIDGKILEKAVRTAMKRYPYFSVKVVVKDDTLATTRNYLPVRVKSGDKPFKLGGKTANYHLLAFCYLNNTVYVDFLHGLTDLSGIVPLMKTVFYYYCCEKYKKDLPADGINLVGSDFLPGELDDPVDVAYTFPRTNTQGQSEAPKRVAPFLMSSDPEVVRKEKAPMRRSHLNGIKYVKHREPSQIDAFRIRIKEEDLMKYVKDTEGSPATIIALLFSRAMDKLYPNAGKPIIGALAANTKPYLGIPNSHSLLLGQVMLEYDEKMKKMDTDMQITCFRGKTFLQTQPEAMIAQAQGSADFVSYINSLKSLDEKFAIVRGILKQSLGAVTFNVSYYGKFDFGAASKYIKNMFTYVGTRGIEVLIEASAYNGYFNLTFLQDYVSDKLVKAFLKELDVENVSYEYYGVEEKALYSGADFINK